MIAAWTGALGETRLNEHLLESIEVCTGGTPRLGIIWLHGLGADGHDFEPIVSALDLPFAARFVFPHAPTRPITINNSMRMRAWFDILSLSRDGAEDEAAIRASSASVRSLIDREIARGLDSTQVVLAGFSQGGALALHLGLREPRRLGGIMALSAFLPLAWTLATEKSTANAEIPILMAHGTADPVIEIAFAVKSMRHLEAEGYMPLWKTYAMGHNVIPEEIVDIAAWLRDVERRAG